MSSTSSPQTKPSRPKVLLDDEDPHVKLGEVETPYGIAVVRLRRVSVPFYVGGRGYVPTAVYEAEVRTPRSLRERQAPETGGFVLVDGHVLVGGRTPRDFLEAFGVVADQIDAAVHRRLAEATRAADRRPHVRERVARPSMPSAPGREEPGTGGPATPPPAPPDAPPASRLRAVRATLPNAA